MKLMSVLRPGAFCLLFILSICSKSLANPCTVAINVSPAGPINAGGGAGNGTFTVNTGGTAAGSSCHWQASSSASFVTLSPSSGGGGGVFQFQVTFTIAPNPNLGTRSAVLTFTQTEDNTKQTVVINQAAPTGQNFSLAVAPSSQTIISGGSTSYNVSISRSGGFIGAVALSVSAGLPAGATASFNPNNTTGTSSTLTITTSNTTPAGTFPLIISGVNGAVTQNVSATLVVNPGVASGITTVVNPVRNTMDVDYIGTDGNVHQFFYNGTWHSANLSALAAGAQPASLTGGIKAINNTIAGTVEVHYVGTDQHIHTLYFDGTWHHADLSGTAVAPNAASNSSISAGMNPIANVEEVEYINSNRVHQLWYNGTWHYTDLTNAAGALVNADSSSGITNIMNTIANAMEVEYIGTDHHIWGLWYALGGGGVWHTSDLTSASGNPTAAAGSPISSTMDSIANTEDLVYIGSDHNVYELWYNGLWHPANLTTASGAPANADSTSSIRIMMNTIANATEVDYIGTDHNVYSLRYALGGGGVWIPTNLTGTLPATQARAGSPLTSGLNTVANTFDVEYVGTDQHVYLLFFNGTWHVTDLTTTAP